MFVSINRVSIYSATTTWNLWCSFTKFYLYNQPTVEEVSPKSRIQSSDWMLPSNMNSRALLENLPCMWRGKLYLYAVTFKDTPSIPIGKMSSYCMWDGLL